MAERVLTKDEEFAMRANTTVGDDVIVHVAGVQAWRSVWATLDEARAALTQSAERIKELEAAGRLPAYTADDADLYFRTKERAEKAERERDEFRSIAKVAVKSLDIANTAEAVADMQVTEAEAKVARLERTVERTEAVVFAARALRRQCDFPVDTYKRLGGRFDDAVAGILVCRILEAVDALAASSSDNAGAPEGTDANV